MGSIFELGPFFLILKHKNTWGKVLIILNEMNTPQGFLSFRKPENLRQMIPNSRTHSR